MTREQEILNAALQLNYWEDCFEEGAKWADEHPKNPWVSIKERLPEKGQSYVIEYKTPNSNISLFKTFCRPTDSTDEEEAEFFSSFGITYWLPIPQLSVI